MKPSFDKLATTTISLGRVLKFAPGDIIPIEIPEIVTATVNGVPVFKGKLGVSRGNYALKMVEPVKPALQPSHLKVSLESLNE